MPPTSPASRLSAADCVWQDVARRSGKQRVENFEKVSFALTSKGLFRILLTAALLLTGCGSGSGDGDDIVQIPTVPVTNTQGIAAFQFELARAVPADVDTIEFFGFDIDGDLIYGPAPRTKAPEIVLESLPIYIRSFRLDYYDGDFLVGQGEVDVILSPNGRVTINNPDFVDVNVASLVVAPEAFELTLGSSRQLNVTTTLTNGDVFTVNNDTDYSSSNPAVVSVDGAGRVTGNALGTATITADYRGTLTTSVIEVVPPNNNP